MFGNDETGKGVHELADGIRKYFDLQKEYVRLELVEKLSILLSAILLVFILVILGMVALFYLLFAFAHWIAPVVGGLMVSFAIITLVVVVCVLVIYLKRESLIQKPIVRFLAKLFLSSSKKK